MQKNLIAFLALASSLTASVASAQDFSDRGTLAFSADRLFGLYLTHRELDPDADFDFEDDDEATEVGLLWQAEGLTPFTIPRLSVDYFVIDHLSLGGSLGVTVADNNDDDDMVP